MASNERVYMTTLTDFSRINESVENMMSDLTSAYERMTKAVTKLAGERAKAP
jgi:hypothetical protein